MLESATGRLILSLPTFCVVAKCLAEPLALLLCCSEGTTELSVVPMLVQRLSVLRGSLCQMTNAWKSPVPPGELTMPDRDVLQKLRTGPRVASKDAKESSGTHVHARWLSTSVLV